MLRSSNPVLSRRDAFTVPGSGQSAYAQQPYGQAGVGAGYQAQPAYPGQYPPSVPLAAQDRMTFDDVIVKTIGMMVVMVLAAALSWWSVSFGVVPVGLMMPAALLSALVGFVAVLMVSLRRKVNPAFVFVYAAVEGIFIGMISMLFENMYSGIVMQAVIGTFAAAGVTLAAYKIFNIRVTPKFRKIVVLATIGFAATLFINLIFSVVGVHLGLTGIGHLSGLAILFSAIGVVLAVLNLVLDFDYIERGVAMGAPSNESWRAAFGLVVTMVWLYVELLRILSIFRQ
jgi:uncharacterized YccA/Bax inhibitor family protein